MRSSTSPASRHNPSVLRGIAVAWGGVLYYYKADRAGLLSLLAGLLLFGAGLVRALSFTRLAVLALALALSQSMAMFRYAMRAILLLCHECGLPADYELGMRMIGLAEVVALLVVSGLAVVLLASR